MPLPQKGKKPSLKRRRDADLEEMAAGPSGSAEDEPAVLDLHFDETIDEEVSSPSYHLKKK